MVTARDMIRTSLRTLGVLASGETVPGPVAQDALASLNALVDSWSNESLLIYVVERVDVPLVAGKQVYTWGQGGDIAGPRPLRLVSALLRHDTQDYEWPLDLLDQRAYEAISMKHLTTLYPSSVYYSPTMPLGTLAVWPIPTEVNTLGLFPWVLLDTFTSLDTALSFPPGYQRFIETGLAVELCDEYGKEPTATLVARYTEAKASIKRVNTRVPVAGIDGSYSRNGGQWWVYTGNYV